MKLSLVLIATRFLKLRENEIVFDHDKYVGKNENWKTKIIFWGAEKWKKNGAGYLDSL